MSGNSRTRYMVTMLESYITIWFWCTEHITPFGAKGVLTTVLEPLVGVARS